MTVQPPVAWLISGTGGTWPTLSAGEAKEAQRQGYKVTPLAEAPVIPRSPPPREPNERMTKAGWDAAFKYRRAIRPTLCKGQRAPAALAVIENAVAHLFHEVATVTIRVIVKNDETLGGRTLRVMVCQRPRTGSQSEHHGGDIAPQETQEFYVHAAQHLIVEEYTT